MKKLSKIAISSRVLKSPTYVEKRDGISQDWSDFLSELDLLPIIVPNRLHNLVEFLNEIQINGIILSGGDNLGDFPERDDTEQKLIDYGILNKIPIFGVCRGMQILNSFFGGNSITTSDKKHIVKSHEINLLNESIFNLLNSKSITVNSFHNNIINRQTLSNEFNSVATHEDNSIEAIIHNTYPIMGVMWHPERQNDSLNKLLISKFFEKHNG